MTFENTCTKKFTHLELHGRVLLVLWRGVALVVQVVGGGGVDDGGLLRGLVEALTVHVDQEGQQPRPQEAGNTGGDQVDGGERCRQKRTVIEGYLPTSVTS